MWRIISIKKLLNEVPTPLLREVHLLPSLLLYGVIYYVICCKSVRFGTKQLNFIQGQLVKKICLPQILLVLNESV